MGLEQRRHEGLQRILDSNQRGEHTGIYSVCSANQAVLEATMAQALRDDSLLCIESTSNQVNQYGGTRADSQGFCGIRK